MIFYIDVIDACNLNCPACIQGLCALVNAAKKMSLDGEVANKVNNSKSWFRRLLSTKGGNDD